MIRETGRWLWRIAYLIEIVCVIGLLGILRGQIDPGRFPGLDLSWWLSAGLALGISLWVVGMAALSWPRRKARDPEGFEDHESPR